MEALAVIAVLLLLHCFDGGQPNKVGDGSSSSSVWKDIVAIDVTMLHAVLSVVLMLLATYGLDEQLSFVDDFFFVCFFFFFLSHLKNKSLIEKLQVVEIFMHAYKTQHSIHTHTHSCRAICWHAHLCVYAFWMYNLMLIIYCRH